MNLRFFFFDIRRNSSKFEDTFFDVLILVEGLDGVVLAKSSERVDEMGAQVRVDVLRAELAGALAVDGPVCEVADHSFVLVDLTFR